VGSGVMVWFRLFYRVYIYIVFLLLKYSMFCRPLLIDLYVCYFCALQVDEWVKWNS